MTIVESFTIKVGDRFEAVDLDEKLAVYVVVQLSANGSVFAMHEGNQGARTFPGYGRMLS